MTFTWANGRNLQTVSKGSSAISYSYDSDSNRTSKTVDGAYTRYIVYFVKPFTVRPVFKPYFNRRHIRKPRHAIRVVEVLLFYDVYGGMQKPVLFAFFYYSVICQWKSAILPYQSGDKSAIII